MGASLNEIKTKIESTKKTSQITGAMQMVSAAKLSKSEESAKNFQIYAQKVRSITTDLLAGEHISDSQNPMLISRPVKSTGYIVITSDKGLVGGYNSTILKTVMQMLNDDHDSQNEYSILALGGTGADFFKARGIDVAYELRGLSDQPSFDEVRSIVSTAVGMYQNEIFDELYVCYTHHINSITSQVRVEKMLPISDIDSNEAQAHHKQFELEPDRDAILETLLPQYAESMIYGSIIDAKTAEHAAGMSAMKTATDNAKNVIGDLTIQYNRARQGRITQEIIEVVTGAAALD
ncbi:F0F1 ATP synthase subunit gamma [Streptococcaceae bacterium ESL0729]|nr:F0F1 ATP synthase subunit gamma [Streptococcaceae bacterium ESL0729]